MTRWLLLALTLLSITPPPADGQTRGGTLKISYAEPTHLNNAIVSGTPTGFPATQLFASLIQFDDKFQPRPYLAERWDIAPDGRTYTFFLVKNATFHDGKPVTSADVKFSIETVKANHPFGVAMHRALEAVETPDAHTVVFRLNHPYPAFMSTLAPLLMPVLPRHVFGDGDIRKHSANTKPVGSGPFKFVEWQRGRYLILERNDKFFMSGKPYLDRIVFEFIQDPAARFAAFETGSIHLMPYNYVGVANLKRVESMPQMAVTTRGYEAIGPLIWVEINLRKKELSDVRVRQAIAHSIDKNLIPQASKLLDDAGYRRGSDGMRFKLTMDIIPGTSEAVSIAEYIREQGKKIGVDYQIRTSPDFPTWAGRMASWEYDLSLDVVFNYPDPVIGVERTYISSNIKKLVWSNTMGYSNPKVDELFARAEREVNFERRKAAYHQLQDILTAELPLIWLFELGFATVWNKEFDGIPTNIWGTMSPFLDVHWKKAK